VVHKTNILDELIERSRDLSMSPEQLRAQRPVVRLRQHRNREPRSDARDHCARGR
jgi:hypothetical protein